MIGPATYKRWRVYLGGHIIAERVSSYDGRRITACLNACKDFTTEGLERIISDDKTLELALVATARLERKIS